MPNRYSFLLLTLLISGLLAAQAPGSPVGRWQTIDDETGKVRSTVEIYEDGGKFFGKVVNIASGNNDAKCTECSGRDRNRPILGLVIIRDLERDGDEFNGGTILDPEKGSEYRLSAWFADNDPDKLYIRGKHWTGLYRTVHWLRE